ncbi:MAG: twin-arginine translocase subunit TatB [Alphaproteobacteria bacterium]|nr:twin-arginine translocase subunit TatB [Alphaproteobacteria bacterium]
MFDIGWSEFAVIALVALVVIGPKDLPGVLRAAGRWAGKARGMAREFQSHVDEMMREAELDEVKKTLETVQHTSVGRLVENTIDPGGDMAKAFDVGFDDPLAPKAAVAPPPAVGAVAAVGAVGPVPAGPATAPVSPPAPSETPPRAGG